MPLTRKPHSEERKAAIKEGMKRYQTCMAKYADRCRVEAKQERRLAPFVEPEVEEPEERREELIEVVERLRQPTIVEALLKAAERLKEKEKEKPKHKVIVKKHPKKKNPESVRRLLLEEAASKATSLAKAKSIFKKWFGKGLANTMEEIKQRALADEAKGEKYNEDEIGRLMMSADHREAKKIVKARKHKYSEFRRMMKPLFKEKRKLSTGINLLKRRIGQTQGDPNTVSMLKKHLETLEKKIKEVRKEILKKQFQNLGYAKSGVAANTLWYAGGDLMFRRRGSDGLDGTYGLDANPIIYSGRGFITNPMTTWGWGISHHLRDRPPPTIEEEDASRDFVVRYNGELLPYKAAKGVNTRSEVEWEHYLGFKF